MDSVMILWIQFIYICMRGKEKRFFLPFAVIN